MGNSLSGDTCFLSKSNRIDSRLDNYKRGACEGPSFLVALSVTQVIIHVYYHFFFKYVVCLQKFYYLCTRLKVNNIVITYYIL